MADGNNKVRQPYLKYDSVLIGPQAKDLDTGYYNDWTSLARSGTLRWFTDRTGGVPNWASSQQTDRSDWAFEVYQAGIEFYAPSVNALFNSNVTDLYMPEIFTTQLAQQMDFEWKIADVDYVLKVPGVHAPAGVGPSGIVYDSSPAGVVMGANNGEPIVSNSWKFPDPLRISTRTTISVESRIEQPLNQLFSGISGPGFKSYPNGDPAGTSIRMPNYYWIRVWLRGARYIENIGARG